jgi:hypothetical protein
MTDNDNESGEFLPLPFLPWDRRPSHVPIDVEEAATALYLAGGSVDVAAEKLRCEALRLQRAINRSPRLVRLHQELVALLNDRVLQEYRRAFDSEDDRRREWAASKVANTKQFQGHPLAPNSQQTGVAVSSPNATRIIISWDDGLSDDQPLIEHDSTD